MILLEKYRVRWWLLSKRLLFWLSAEIILGIVGLDSLADCVEYLLNRQKLVVLGQPVYASDAIIPNYQPLEFTSVATQDSLSSLR